MTEIILSACLALCFTGFTSQKMDAQVPDGVYYLVRHAEKDTGKNPALTTAGYARAGDLYRQLKNDKISKIYVSQYRRTELTADSLRIYKKADTLHYQADANGDDLLNKLADKKNKARNVLIIGHSNTIPAILKRLGVTALNMNEIPDNEHDNLFVVTIRNKKVSLKWLKYGKPPQLSSKQGAM